MQSADSGVKSTDSGVKSADSEMQGADSGSGAAETVEPKAAEETSHAVVSIPGSLRAEQRPSFWRRIRLGGLKSGLPAPTDDDRLLARLDAIAAQLAGTDQRIEQLDQRFGEVWEAEEQLSLLMELRDIGVDLQERQGRIDGRLRGLERRLSLISLLAGVAAAAGLAAVAVAFL